MRGALAAASARLSASECATPRLDAEILLASVLGVGRERLVIEADAAVDPAAASRFAALIDRRGRREPVAYLTGVKAFRRLELAVDRRVLIPRPETELLVEAALELAPGVRVVDVGCGSGAVALALKDERSDLIVAGVDISPDAVAVARANATRLGLDVTFGVADLLDGVEGHIDGVVANLPYVTDGDPTLAPEIAVYEPTAALYGGLDGLDLLRRLVAQLGGVGFVALEVGAGQAPMVSRLLASAGYAAVERRRDLAGHERVVVGRR